MQGRAGGGLVGVTHGWRLHRVELKRLAMMFDQLACVSLTQTFRELMDAPEKKYFAAELEFLMKNEFLYEPDFFSEAAHLSNNKEFTDLLNEFVRRDKKMDRLPIEGSIKNSVQFLVEYATQQELILRLMSTQLRALKNLDAVPLISSQLSSSFGVGKCRVLEIVLNRMPQPNSSVPWEQILEFRNDPEMKGKFWALRAWITELARANLSPTEVVEKLECSLHEYQQHMKLARIKTNWGACRTLVCVAAEVAEDLIKFKWGKAAQMLFILQDRRLALAEAELQAPGKEVAYIVAAGEQFSSGEP